MRVYRYWGGDDDFPILIKSEEGGGGKLIKSGGAQGGKFVNFPPSPTLTSPREHDPKYRW